MNTMFHRLSVLAVGVSMLGACGGGGGSGSSIASAASNAVAGTISGLGSVIGAGAVLFLLEGLRAFKGAQEIAFGLLLMGVVYAASGPVMWLVGRFGRKAPPAA